MTGSMITRAFGAGFEMMRALAHAPAVIAAFDDADQSPPICPGPHRPPTYRRSARSQLNRHGIAEAVSPNLLPDAVFIQLRLLDKGVVRRNTVVQFLLFAAFGHGGAGIDINPQNFPEQRGGVLAVVVRIVAPAAVAQGDIKKAVRPELDLAGLVVLERLRHFQHDALGFQVGRIGVGGGNLEFADDAAAGIELRVINVKQPVGSESPDGTPGPAIRLPCWCGACGRRCSEIPVRVFRRRPRGMTAMTPSCWTIKNRPRVIRRLFHSDRQGKSRSRKIVPQGDFRQRLARTRPARRNRPPET